MNRAFSYINYILASFSLLCALVPLFYGIFNVGTGAFFLISAWLFAFPAVWRLLGHTPALNALRILLAVFMCLFFLYSACVSAMMARKAWFNPPPAGGGATVIVLGAKITGNQPSLMLRRRLNAAYNYLRDNPEAFCIVTGGQGPDEDYPEAHVMKGYLEALGIEPTRIKAEDKSTNTKQNLRFSADYVKESTPVVIVTDSFHQLRAYIYAKKEFANAQPEGFYGISSLTPWGLMPSYWIRDMFGAGFAWMEYRLAVLENKIA